MMSNWVRQEVQLRSFKHQITSYSRCLSAHESGTDSAHAVPMWPLRKKMGKEILKVLRDKQGGVGSLPGPGLSSPAAEVTVCSVCFLEKYTA